MARANQQNNSRQQEADARALVVQPPRLPMPREAAPEGVSPGQWKVLVDAVFPSAKTVDGVMMALRYCKERGLDVFKRPVHVVPMWNSALSREVETVWPGINDYRTTASRTAVWAGNDECVFGPTLREGFKEKATRGYGQNAKVIEAHCEPFSFPEWAQVTVYKVVAGVRVPFVGPKVYFKEIFSGEKGLRVPNARWRQAPIQMLEKCAEAAALRRAFPEELGSEYTAEEMEGKVYAGDPIEAARQRYSGQPAENDTLEREDAPRPTRENVRGWSDEIQADIDWVQQSIDRTTVPEALLRAKNAMLEHRAEWPEAARKELERRFDVRLTEISDDEAGADGANDTTNEETTTSEEEGNDEQATD